MEGSFLSAEKIIFNLNKLFSSSDFSFFRVQIGLRTFTPVTLGVTFEMGTSLFEERAVGAHGES